MNAVLTVSLVDARFHAFHGVLEQERKVGNEFSVDLSVDVSVPFSNSVAAGITDEIKDTVSYADLYEIVRNRMSEPCRLIEHLAALIADDVRGKWPSVERIDVKITKQAPPIPNSAVKASVSLKWDASTQ